MCNLLVSDRLPYSLFCAWQISSFHRIASYRLLIARARVSHFCLPPELLLTMGDELQVIVGPAWRDLLTCGICRDLHVRPAALSCQHTFCTACISRWIDTFGSEGLIPCPICMVLMARDLTPNFQVQQTMDLVPVACPECHWKGKGISSYQDHIALWCPSVLQKSVSDLIAQLDDERAKNHQYEIEVEDLKRRLYMANPDEEEDRGEPQRMKERLATAEEVALVWQERAMRQQQVISDSRLASKMEIEARDAKIQGLHYRLHDVQQAQQHGGRFRLRSRSPQRRARDYSDHTRCR